MGQGLLSTELLAATFTLWAVLLLSGYRPPASWRVAALLGLLEPALAYLGDTVGLSQTAAVNGSIISGLESGLVIALAAVLPSETITRAALVAIVLALGGLVIIAGEGGRGTAIGDLCVTAGVLSASLYSIAAKRFDDGSDALSLTAWQFSAVTIASLRSRPRVDRDRPSPVDGCRPAVLARVDAGWTAIVLNLIPLFGLLSAISLRGEVRGSGIGALLIGASVTYFTICDRRDSRGTVDGATGDRGSRTSPPAARRGATGRIPAPQAPTPPRRMHERRMPRRWPGRRRRSHAEGAARSRRVETLPSARRSSQAPDGETAL
jgi:O-acetylserine/cysteine efflux transporter